LNTEILQGSVATQLKCGGIFNKDLQILKIDYHLVKSWTKF